MISNGPPSLKYLFSEFGFGEESVPGDPHVRGTHMFSLGRILRKLVRTSPLYTDDCQQADAVIVAYDIGLEYYLQYWDAKAFPASNTSAFFWQRKPDFLPLASSKLHLFPISKVERDYRGCEPGERGTRFLCDAATNENVIFMTIEKKFGGSGSHSHAIAVPYPSRTHFSHAWRGGGSSALHPSHQVHHSRPLNASRRDLLVFGTWRIRKLRSTPRAKLARHCRARPNLCYFYPGDNRSSKDPFKDEHAAAYYRRSVFCL